MSPSILVDTSIWIHLFGKSRKFKIDADRFKDIYTCPPIIQEVLQGIKEEAIRARLKGRFLALTGAGNPLPLERYLAAADLYASGRRRGLTIRSSTDCLIAAIAIHANLTVWHSDRDFEAIAKFTSLKTFTRTSLN